MKKRITLLSILLALCLALAVFAACGVTEVNEVTMVTPPKTTFDLNESLDNLDFVISVKVNSNDQPVTYSYQNDKDKITVTGFSTATIGDYVATITVNGNSALKYEFNYTVANSDYAGGAGTELNPYLISTPAQFQNLLFANEFHYYKLANTIDFAGIALKQPQNGYHDKATNNEKINLSASDVWAGSIDGAGYSLLNINQVTRNNGAGQNKYGELFGRVASAAKGPFVMKNITINYAADKVNAPAGLIFSNGTDAEISFENVNFSGYIDLAATAASASSAAVNIPGKTLQSGDFSTVASVNLKSLTFKNCTNTVRFISSNNVAYSAGYVGGNNGNFDSISFENCSFGGSIEGAKTNAGAFVSFDKTHGPSEKISFTGCTVLSSARIVNLNNSIVSGVNVFKGVVTNDKAGITNQAVSLVDTSISKFTATVNTTDKTVTVSGAPSTASSYRIFVGAGLNHTGGGGGTFNYENPIKDSEKNGTTFSLYTMNYSTGNFTNTTDYGFGTTRITLSNNVATFYCAGIGSSISVKTANITVLAYDATGAIVGYANGNVTIDLTAPQA